MNTYHMPKVLLIAAMFFMVLGFSALSTSGALAAPTAPGDIIINEIMKDPETPLSDNNDWIEIVNLTGSDIDINGWILESAAALNHTMNNTIDPTIVSPGAYYVICATRDASFTCDYEAGTGFSGLNLANTSGSVALVDGVDITRIDYDTTNWPNVPARSMEYSVPIGGGGAVAENTDPANWASATNEFTTGNFGTPAAINQNPTAVTMQNITSDPLQVAVSPITIALVLILGAATATIIYRRPQK